MCAAFSLAGCVSTDGVSFPVSFPAASQYKLKSAAHWQLIAEDVAGQMKQSLMAQNHLQAAIYLEEPAQPTAFERSLLPMLRAGLLSQGLKVSVRSQDAAVLKVQVSKVSHVASYRPGTLTLLGGGLLVLREIVRHHSPVLIDRRAAHCRGSGHQPHAFARSAEGAGGRRPGDHEGAPGRLCDRSE